LLQKSAAADQSSLLLLSANRPGAPCLTGQTLMTKLHRVYVVFLCPPVTVDVTEAIRLWPLAANMVACHVAGLGLGWLQVKTLGTPASLAPQVTVMTAVGNIGTACLLAECSMWVTVVVHSGMAIAHQSTTHTPAVVSM
jgi:hypothetical protein